MSLVRACSSCDSVSLYQQTWETSSLLSFSGQSTLCRQALLLKGRCTDIWRSDLPPGRRCRHETGPVPEVVSFCSPHSYLCRLVLEGSGNQDEFPWCFSKAHAGRGGHLSSGREGAQMSGALKGVCLRSCPLGTLRVSTYSMPKVTWCWC